MGLAASQARLLSLTARIHDVEYQAQMIQSAKLQLATQEDEVYKKYNEALEATTLTFQDTNGNRIPANFYNLCGYGSINNDIGNSKQYAFRTSDYRLLIPSDVFSGMEEYMDKYGKNTDPYDFAMYMMFGDNREEREKTMDYMDAEGNNCYHTNKTAAIGNADNLDEKSKLKSLSDAILNKISELYNLRTESPKDENNNDITDLEKGPKALRDQFLLHPGNVSAYWEPDKLDSNQKEKYKSLVETVQKYQYLAFQQQAKDIWSNTMICDAEDFDRNKFNYYLRWALLIEDEGGMDDCTNVSSYSETFENDSDSLQSMLQSGRIFIEEISLTQQGDISNKTTSVATEGVLEYTATSTIDKKALAKAEAEYEHAMKQLDKKDKKFDMDLNRLETERTALTTEYDSVKKVIQDNVERTFGIFS